MIRTIAVSIILLLVFFSQAQACYYQPKYHTDRSDGLYQVVNGFFVGDGNSQQKFKNNFDLLLTSVLPNAPLSLVTGGQDDQWWSTGDQIRVDALYQNSGFWPGINLLNLNNGLSLFPGRHGKRDQYTALNDLDLSFTVLQSIAEMDFGYQDHFLAFSINDTDMLSTFEDRYVGTDYYGDTDDVWLIAFEGFGRRRVGYADLVAVVSRIGDYNPVPLPASILFLASALGGLVCFPNRRRSHSDVS